MCDKHDFFFEFDKAFTAQLIQKFEASPEHPLNEDVAPPRKGCTHFIEEEALFMLEGRSNYIEAPPRRTCEEHLRKERYQSSPNNLPVAYFGNLHLLAGAPKLGLA